LTEILTAKRPAHAPAPAAAPAAEPASGSDGDHSIVRSWSGPKIGELIRSPDLRRVYDRWMALIESKLPRLNEITGAEQQVGLDDAMLLLRLPNDFMFVHHGADAVKMIGVNLAGMLLSEQKNAVADAIRKVYAKCVAIAEPIYIRHIAPNASQQHFFLEQIALPIAADERREVGFVLAYSSPLDDQNEVLKAVFERSQIGMIAAASNHDESGKLLDGRILLINARARAILKLPESMDRIHTVRDLGPWFRDGALWTKINVVSAGGATHIHYRDRASETSYRVSIEPIDRFALFSIIEIPQIQ
jgi:PAS domain-containing protein